MIDPPEDHLFRDATYNWEFRESAEKARVPKMCKIVIRLALHFFPHELKLGGLVGILFFYGSCCGCWEDFMCVCGGGGPCVFARECACVLCVWE